MGFVLWPGQGLLCTVVLVWKQEHVVYTYRLSLKAAGLEPAASGIVLVSVHLHAGNGEGSLEWRALWPAELALDSCLFRPAMVLWVLPGT